MSTSAIKGSLPTILISPQDIAQIVSKKGLKEVFEGVADYILKDYLRWNEFDKSARVASYLDNGVLELMPIASKDQYSFKYVNCHPDNPKSGLSTVLAFGALINNSTGLPGVISEFTLTTAIRTAAMSALTARFLARKNSKRMAIIGNGCQSEFQALAFHYLLGINELALFDIDKEASKKLAENLKDTSIQITICDSVEEAVKGADIITTVTAEYSKAHIIKASMIEKGMHINAVGGDSPGKTELEPSVLNMGKVYIEFEPQTRVEGELQNMPADFEVSLLSNVFASGNPARTSDEEITIFDSVGFAIEDFSAVRYMTDVAKELGLAQAISIAPNLDNPKDLFNYLKKH
ncbi:ornithine cyclodeaminase [Pelistega indica]|uniref:Ornithine cyclodeaminase n=1 Tax=Pelistega indica TaxID=1414851 RepID=V8G800_9BURK|nr:MULTISPECIES: ornithine cyclodeaminase [Pelistega]ETD72520.1 ornithine cyclodeaminase [Pelistega indica]